MNRFTFPCRAKGYATREGKKVVRQYIKDKLKGKKLISIVKRPFVLDGEQWIDFTITYR